MRLLTLFCSVLIILCFVTITSAMSYEFEVEASGQTTAYVTISDSAVISLPSDVGNPEVIDGTFTLVEDGVEVTVDSGKEALLAYESSFHTKKEEGIWTFSVFVVDSEKTALLISQDVQVIKASPRAAITKTDGTQLKWGALVNQQIEVTYVPLTSSTSLIRRNRVRKATSNPWLLISVLFLVFLVVAYFMTQKKKCLVSTVEVVVDEESESLPKMTDGQMNIIRAANSNDQKVLTVILSHQGHIKRNKLEKETGLSKSSLASSLNGLEKKDIIVVDRSFHVHYVKLSDWFKGL